MARALCILLPTAFIFFGLWTLHLDILKFSGQGDNFMIEEFKGMLATKPPRAPKPGQLDPLACPNVVNTWSDCGYAGISEAQCLAAGCCWDPTSSRAWCYHLGERRRPAMAWWPKILETLRATWANNNGGAVMEHPFMSQWWEWPTQFGASTVPFAATREGGQIKALGNPAVWLGVFANFCGATVVGWGCIALWGAGSPLLRQAADAVGAGGEGAAALDKQGWLIPFVVLWSGYLLNLVPYQLIARSKFVYHYIPALVVGVLLFALSVDWLLSVVGGRARARVLAALIAAALFATVAFAFYYWNVPYGYGYRITPEQNKARLWSRKW